MLCGAGASELLKDLSHCGAPLRGAHLAAVSTPRWALWRMRALLGTLIWELTAGLAMGRGAAEPGREMHRSPGRGVCASGRQTTIGAGDERQDVGQGTRRRSPPAGPARGAMMWSSGSNHLDTGRATLPPSLAPPRRKCSAGGGWEATAGETVNNPQPPASWP